MDVDVIIIGAGVIGLAIAREISQNGHSVLILEKETPQIVRKPVIIYSL